jgi:hypothetical protein
MLLALHAVLADKFALTMMASKCWPSPSRDEVFAGHAGEDELLDLVGVHHFQALSFQPRFSRFSVTRTRRRSRQ